MACMILKKIITKIVITSILLQILFFLKNSYAGNIGFDNTVLILPDNTSSTTIRYFTQIIPTSDTTITKLGVVQPTSGSGSLGRIILTIYSNNDASNVPNTLLGQTSIASQSYGGGNLEIALSSSIDLTANTKYWVGPIPVDGHNSYMGVKYNCSQPSSVKFAYFSTTNSSSNPTTALNSWSSYPNAVTSPSVACAIGHYAVEGSASNPVTNPITDKDVVGSIDSQSQIAKNLISQSTSIVSNRLGYLRQNKGNDNLSKQNIKLDFGNALLTSLTSELLAKNDKSIIPDNWSSWSEGSISVSKIGDRLGSSSSETDGQALAFGFDTKLNDNDLLGFAVQYGQSDTDIGSSGSTTDSENINLSVYRTRPLNDDNFIEGMFGVGLIESDLVRVSGSNTLTGSRNGTQIFGSVNYGKTIDKGDFNLTPIARVDLGYTELDAYSETGTDALSYAKQTIESGLASLGLEVNDIIRFNQSNLKPFGKVEYGLDFSNSSDAKMHYVSDTSTTYTYTQGVNSTHILIGEIGFNFESKENLLIITSYKRTQGSESEHSDTIKFGLNFKSKRETEYAMSIDGSEDLAAGFDISKNVNGFDINFNAKQSFNKNADQEALISLIKRF